jgi:hypothetical protein
MKLNKSEFLKWIAALESGKYEQGKSYLVRGSCFCCLGVFMTLRDDFQNTDYSFVSAGETGIQHLPGSICSLLGIDTVGMFTEFGKEVCSEMFNIDARSLTNMNDTFNLTFIQIAAFLKRALEEDEKGNQIFL